MEREARQSRAAEGKAANENFRPHVVQILCHAFVVSGKQPHVELTVQPRNRRSTSVLTAVFFFSSRYG